MWQLELRNNDLNQSQNFTDKGCAYVYHNARIKKRKSFLAYVFSDFTMATHHVTEGCGVCATMLQLLWGFTPEHTVFWDVSPSSRREIYWRFEEDVNTVLSHAGTFLPHYKFQHLIKQHSTYSPLWQPEMLHATGDMYGFLKPHLRLRDHTQLPLSLFRDIGTRT
jgi:hypothetical protein